MIKLTADKIKTYGPKIDGGYTITLDVGEYEQKNIAKIVGIKQPCSFEVTIDKVDE